MENGCSLFKIIKTAPFHGQDMRPLRDYKTIFFVGFEFNRKENPIYCEGKKVLSSSKNFVSQPKIAEIDLDYLIFISF